MKTRSSYRISRSSLYAVVLLLGFASAEANTVRIFSLSADEWARPRSGAVIPELEAVRAAVRYWEQVTPGLIVIRHPGEDTGEIWAAELRDWLISLGVAADYIRLRAGNQDADEIDLLVGGRDELEQ
ncbi:MAG: hypothetical protein QNJ85_05650 [Gammaproteobacteria bacterium]|nr:hypothetical protein [Gammaproteobacteria bacterium]